RMLRSGRERLPQRGHIEMHIDIDIEIDIDVDVDVDTKPPLDSQRLVRPGQALTNDNGHTTRSCGNGTHRQTRILHLSLCFIKPFYALNTAFDVVVGSGNKTSDTFDSRYSRGRTYSYVQTYMSSALVAPSMPTKCHMIPSALKHQNQRLAACMQHRRKRLLVRQISFQKSKSNVFTTFPRALPQRLAKGPP
ncbi:Hypothetical predicted protein, partial [Drosophila guanche]